MSSDLSQPPNQPAPPWPAPPAQGFDPSYVPYGYQQPPATRAVPLSKAAVASLVFGIIGGVVFAIGFGIAGLSATANGSRRGRGFAWAGLVLAVVWVVGIIAVVVIVNGHKADRNLDGSVSKAGTSDVLSLQKGDCLQDPTAAAAFDKVDVVPCTQAHDSQIYTVVSLSDGTFDRTRIKAEIEKSCTTAASTAIDPAGASPSWTIGYFYPDPDSWSSGLRTGVCEVTSPTPLTRSVLKAG